MTQKFNVSGDAGRDCPICFRAGSLFGARDGDAPRLTCSGCATQFVLTWSSAPGVADTLTRIPVPPRERATSFALTASP